MQNKKLCKYAIPGQQYRKTYPYPFNVQYFLNAGTQNRQRKERSGVQEKQ